MSEPRIIRIVCIDSGHANRKVIVLTFHGIKDAATGELVWMTKRRARSVSTKPGRNQASGIDDWGLSDDAVAKVQQGLAPQLPDQYKKHVADCNLCGAHLEASDTARLYPILSALYKSLGSEISLSLLERAYNR